MALVLKKGSNILFKGRRIHACAVIAYRQLNVFTRNETPVQGAIGLVKLGVRGLDHDFSHTADGIPGIDAEIGQDLIDLAKDQSVSGHTCLPGYQISSISSPIKCCSILSMLLTA